MDSSGSFDFLVKLASFGTAGVCILAIFIIGGAIVKLPNDAPSWKAQLMKKFINAFIIIASITAVSGGLNAFFNRGKIVEADKKAETSVGETQVVAVEYEKLRLQYADLSLKVTGLLEQMEKNKNSDTPQVDVNAEQIKIDLKESQPKTIDKILDSRSIYLNNKQLKPLENEKSRIRK